MMNILLPTFELVAPLPPYPAAWSTLRDPSDHAVWAAAKLGRADFVVSENRRDYPPAGADGRHLFEEIESVPADEFLSRLVGGQDGAA